LDGCGTIVTAVDAHGMKEYENFNAVLHFLDVFA
jgi:hypothetical protein